MEYIKWKTIRLTICCRMWEMFCFAGNGSQNFLFIIVRWKQLKWQNYQHTEEEVLWVSRKSCLPSNKSLVQWNPKLGCKGNNMEKQLHRLLNLWNGGNGNVDLSLSGLVRNAYSNGVEPQIIDMKGWQSWGVILMWKGGGAGRKIQKKNLKKYLTFRFCYPKKYWK